MIRSANVESPVMFLSDNDSVVRDILSMGQDPGSRAVLHPIAVLISADLSVLSQLSLAQLCACFYLDISSQHKGEGRKIPTSSTDFS